jgi:hypothetical protein
MRFVAVCLRRICGTFGAREDPLVLSCSRHAPVNSTGVISVMLGQETRARELTRNRPQSRCASLGCLPRGHLPSSVLPSSFSTRVPG